MPNVFSYGPNVDLVIGSYTGDGTENHPITGLGGKPRSLEIFDHPTAAGDFRKYEKLDRDWGRFTFLHAVTASYHRIFDDMIISLDDDGFTVSDGGIDGHPNKDGFVYDFKALI